MHDHDHHHHGHDDHHRGHPGLGNERRVFWSMVLTASFMVAEVVGGLLSGSLALLADAGHMLTDAAALALAWFGFRLGRRPADRARSYGYHRLEVLAAFVNGITLILLTVWIAVEAVHRLLAPVPVLGGLMLGVAVLGFVVNLGSFLILHGGDRANLNIRGAVVHIVGDLLGSVAAITAAVVITLTGWTPIDPLLSVLVALLILRSGIVIVRQSGHVLLEGTPEGLDIEAMRRRLAEAVPGIANIHHVHAWSLTAELRLLTLHATIGRDEDQTAILNAVKAHLKAEHGIEHSVVQLEPQSCPDEHAGHHAGHRHR